MSSEFIQRIVARFMLSLGFFGIVTAIYYKINYDVQYVNWFASIRFAALVTLVLTIRYVIKKQQQMKK